MDRSTNFRGMGKPPLGRGAANASLARMRAVPYVPQIRRYREWLRKERGLAFEDYQALWEWSVGDLPAFWQSIWDYFELQSPTPFREVLAEEKMPGARWFEGAQFNYAQQVFRHVRPAHAAGFPAIVSR